MVSNLMKETLAAERDEREANLIFPERLNLSQAFGSNS